MTPAELDALRLEILEHRSRPERHPSTPPNAAERAELEAKALELEALHDRNTRIHGRARAELVRWGALLQLAEYTHRVCQRRKERALLEALEALERAQQAEDDEAKWLRVACWVGRRVDAAAERCSKRLRLMTRIDFNLSTIELGKLEPTDLEEDEVPW